MHPLLLLRTQDTVAVERRRCCRARRGVGAKAPSLNYGLASWLLGRQRERQGAAVPHRTTALRRRLWCSVSAWGRRIQRRRACPCVRRAAVSTWHATAVCAQREAHAAGKEELQGLGMPTATTPRAQRCLTPRSSRAPTAGHQARATGTVYIFRGPGLASHRWCRLTSNVRHHTGIECSYLRYRAISQRSVGGKLRRPSNQPTRTQDCRSGYHVPTLDQQMVRYAKVVGRRASDD